MFVRKSRQNCTTARATSMQKLRERYCKKQKTDALIRRENQISKGIENTKGLLSTGEIEKLEKQLSAYTEELIGTCSAIPKNKLPVEAKKTISFNAASECEPVPENLKAWYNRTDDGYLHKNIICHKMANGKHVKFIVGQELPSSGEIFEVAIAQRGWYGLAVRQTEKGFLSAFLSRIVDLVKVGISALVKFIVMVIKLIVKLIENIKNAAEIVKGIVAKYIVLLAVSLGALAMMTYFRSLECPCREKVGMPKDLAALSEKLKDIPGVSAAVMLGARIAAAARKFGAASGAGAPTPVPTPVPTPLPTPVPPLPTPIAVPIVNTPAARDDVKAILSAIKSISKGSLMAIVAGLSLAYTGSGSDLAGSIAGSTIEFVSVS
jgi:hypothetical protein